MLAYDFTALSPPPESGLKPKSGCICASCQGHVPPRHDRYIFDEERKSIWAQGNPVSKTVFVNVLHEQRCAVLNNAFGGDPGSIKCGSAFALNDRSVMVSPRLTFSRGTSQSIDDPATRASSLAELSHLPEGCLEFLNGTTGTIQPADVFDRDFEDDSTTFESRRAIEPGPVIGCPTPTRSCKQLFKGVNGATLPTNVDNRVVSNGRITSEAIYASPKQATGRSSCRINYDENPMIIRKQFGKEIIYKQPIIVRYLQPPTPEPLPPIIIREVRVPTPPPAPPLLIRQRPPIPTTPSPLFIRERPPEKPACKTPTVIYRRMPPSTPPPRKVIIERLPVLPPKPKPIIIEKWLPYRQPLPRVVYQRAHSKSVPTGNIRSTSGKARNVIVRWEQPGVTVVPNFQKAEIVRADPDEYKAKYGSSLTNPEGIPQLVKSLVKFDSSAIEALLVF